MAQLFIVRLLSASPRAIFHHLDYLGYLGYLYLDLATFGRNTLGYLEDTFGYLCLPLVTFGYVWLPLVLILPVVLGIFWNIIGWGISKPVLRNGSYNPPL